MLLADGVDVLDELKDVGEVLLGESGHVWASVTLGEVFRRFLQKKKCKQGKNRVEADLRLRGNVRIGR